MAWFPKSSQQNNQPSWYQRLAYNVLKMGPIPRHVAIIMDGNRRYAAQKSLKKIQGHSLGFEKLTQTLNWCRDLDISEVTVYAFSIENFKRPKEEVDGLMDLARDKFQQLLKEKKELDKHGVCVRFQGQLDLLPADIQKLAAEIMLSSKDNKRSILNVCLAYTSRQEMVHSIQLQAEAVAQGIIDPSDISEKTMEAGLYSCESRPLDLLIRTSGEVRLSDFQLWQGSFAVLAFMPVLWPEFAFRHFVLAILHFQRHHNRIQKSFEALGRKTSLSGKETKFIEWVKEKNRLDLEMMHSRIC